MPQAQEQSLDPAGPEVSERPREGGTYQLFPRRGLGATLSLYAKGMAVGVSDLVPGFSGGTMALVVGIYEELIATIGSFSDRRFLGALFSGRLREAFRRCHGPFLVTLVAGIATAIVLLAPLAGYLLQNYPVHVSAFFFGLVLASAAVAGGLIGRWTPLVALLLLLGAGGAFVLVGLTPTSTPTGAPFLMLAGAVAVCALVLPGISGSFILILLGKYDVALAAVTARDLGILAPLALGGVLGVILFARLLSYLLRRFHDPMMALLTGFVIGSLRKVWPYLQADGFSPAWPWTASGPDGWWLGALVVAGLLAVLLLERAGRLKATTVD